MECEWVNLGLGTCRRKILKQLRILGSVSIFSRIALQWRLTTHQTAWAKLRDDAAIGSKKLWS